MLEIILTIVFGIIGVASLIEAIRTIVIASFIVLISYVALWIMSAADYFHRKRLSEAIKRAGER